MSASMSEASWMTCRTEPSTSSFWDHDSPADQRHQPGRSDRRSHRPTQRSSVPSSPLKKRQGRSRHATSEVLRPLSKVRLPPGTRKKGPVSLKKHSSKVRIEQDLFSSTAPLAPVKNRCLPEGRMRVTDDFYEYDGRNCRPLNWCALIMFIITVTILLLLGAANMLLQDVGQEFNNVYSDKSLARPGVSNTTRRKSKPLPKRLVHCTSHGCLWEAGYLLGKLNNTISPCQDFYSHVCSADWSRGDTQPYVYKASAEVMQALWNYLKDHITNATAMSFVDQAAILTTECVKGSKKDSEWVTFRDIFRDLNIAEWPYGSEPLVAEPHDVAKVADKLLGTTTFVTVSLRELRSPVHLQLHVDSPPILLRRYETIFPGEHRRTYGDFVYRVLTLWKPASELTQKLAFEIVRLEQTMSDTAAHAARSVPIVRVTKPVVSFQVLPHWDWFAYFSYYIREVRSSISASTVVVLDPPYVANLSILLSQAHPRTLINYIGYRLVIYLSPLLPVNKAYFIVPLSHQYQLTQYVPERVQACMSLLERMYPFGVRSLLWSMVLAKAQSLTIEAGLADDIVNIIRLVRSEMKRSAASAPWLTPNESYVAVQKLDRMVIEIIPLYEEMSLPSSPFLLTPPEPGKLLSTYYKLFRSTRSQYWTARDLTLLRQPSTPRESAFLPGFSYNPEHNVISLSPATVFFALGVSQRFEATSPYFLVAPLIRGIFSTMDLRGSVVDAEGVFRKWWSVASEEKFLTRAHCLQGGFMEEMKAYIRDGLDSSLFMEENVADGAVLRPLYNVFLKLAHKEAPGQPPGGTFSRLFFINYAMTFCDPVRSATNSKKQLWYKKSVPAKLRVNVPLSRFSVFADVFGCSLGTRMNPTHACSFW